MDNVVKFLIQQGKISLGYNVIYTVLDKVHNLFVLCEKKLIDNERAIL